MSETALGTLPEWDLNDLYPGTNSAELNDDIQSSAESAKEFAKAYEGKLSSLDGDGILAALKDYEGIEETLGRIMSYAYLVYAGDMTDPEIGKFFQNMQEKISKISTDLLFFTLELNRIDDERFEEFYKNAELRRYKPWIDNVRAMKPISWMINWKSFCMKKTFPGAVLGFVCLTKQWRA